MLLHILHYLWGGECKFYDMLQILFYTIYSGGLKLNYEEAIKNNVRQRRSESEYIWIECNTYGNLLLHDFKKKEKKKKEIC